MARNELEALVAFSGICFVSKVGFDVELGTLYKLVYGELNTVVERTHVLVIDETNDYGSEYKIIDNEQVVS